MFGIALRNGKCAADVEVLDGSAHNLAEESGIRLARFNGNVLDGISLTVECACERLVIRSHRQPAAHSCHVDVVQQDRFRSSSLCKARYTINDKREGLKFFWSRDLVDAVNDGRGSCGKFRC